RSIISMLSALALILLVTLAGCGGGSTGATQTVTSSTSTGTTPTTTTGGAGDVGAATTALSGVIDRSIKEPDFNTQGFRTDPAVPSALVAKIDRIAAQNEAQGLPGLDVDPFVCAQQLPSAETYKPASVAGDNVTINGRFTYGAGKPVTVTYGMVLED